MLLSFWVILLVFGSVVSHKHGSAWVPLVAQTTNGPVESVIEKYADYAYYSFKSIPYAEPPVGDLRFETPQPYKKHWTKIMKANRTSPVCLQYDLDAEEIVGQEDCLYLNVFVPLEENAPIEERPRLRPVLVFIHGGGFMWGTSSFYGEQYIMKHGKMILVTLNYRVGPFGFLSTEDSHIKGNMGLKDQALALKWIYDNIESFGGDQSKVLLTGWSAGGASVHFHMVSDATKNHWFSGAVSMSGTALCPCHAIHKGESLGMAKKLASLLDCSPEQIEDTQSLKTCLTQKTALSIIQQVPKLYQFGHHPFAIFKPVLEDSQSKESFLTEQVATLMDYGKVKRKPWLLSRTAEDGGIGTVEFLRKVKINETTKLELIYKLNDKWFDWAPIMLFYDPKLSEEEKHARSLALKEKYFGEKSFSVETYPELEQLYNDELAIKHMEQTIRLFRNHSEKVFGFVYDNAPNFGFGQLLAKRTDWKFDTLHGDDLFLIFRTPVRSNYPFRVDERIISKKLLDMLFNLVDKGIAKYDDKVLSLGIGEDKVAFPRITRNGLKFPE